MRGSRKCLLFAWLVIVCGCATTRHAVLPSRPPEAVRLDFSGPDQGWPPKAVGRTNAQPVPWIEIQELGEADLEHLREVALGDPHVRQVLGGRFAFISASPFDQRKNPQLAATPSVARLSFYSYDHNQAVDVVVVRGKVASCRERPGYQPPEGRDEIARAERLARDADPIRGQLDGLKAHAIVTFARRDEPGFTHRLIHVSFVSGDEDLPRFYAIVDLTLDRVLSAGRNE